MAKVKYCEYCKNHPEVCKQTVFRGYSNFWQDNVYDCPICKNKMIDTILEDEEMDIIENISLDINFLESMISLKEKDPIEYQLKMSQFRNQVEQQKQ